MQIEKHTLDNGLTMLLKESRHAPVTTFWVWYRVGSRNEVPGITGISHYAEHMLTQRQRDILARPLWPARIWRRCFKPVYNFVTRRILGWPERNSAIERTY